MLHFLTVFIYFPALVFNLRAFDRLVALEYRKHREEWEKDRSPYGFFWSPPERTWASQPNYSARNRVAMSWLFTTPDWIEEDPEALSLVSRLRNAWLLAHLVGLPVFILLNMMLTVFD